MRGTLMEHLYEISRDLHEAGLLSDEKFREHDLMCRPRRARWRVQLGDALYGWGRRTERFFYWDLLWQRRVESFLRKRLGGFWLGQPDNREALAQPPPQPRPASGAG